MKKSILLIFNFIYTFLKMKLKNPEYIINKQKLTFKFNFYYLYIYISNLNSSIKKVGFRDT